VSEKTGNEDFSKRDHLAFEKADVGIEVPRAPKLAKPTQKKTISLPVGGWGETSKTYIASEQC